MKKRVTLTLDSNLLKRVDSSIDGSAIKNRSHAVELFLARALNNNSVPKKALILAGGRGTRFDDWTKEIPKPMIMLDGKPLLGYTIDLLKNAGINDITISVGYFGNKIKEYFKDGKEYGVSITYTEEKTPLGTAGPMKLVKNINEPFILCNADELRSIDIADMYSFHKKNRALATIALTTVENPSEYGVARLKGNKILEFVEKPKNPPTRLISSGFYIVEPKVLEFIKTGFSMVETDIFPRIAMMDKLYGYSYGGYWKGINNQKDFADALADIENGEFKV